MLIVIDGRMPKDCGIGRYAHNLFRSLCEIDKVNDYILLEDSRIKWMSLQEQWQLPQLLKILKADVFHATSFVSLRNCPCKQVITIHDLIHVLFPSGIKKKLYYEFNVNPALKKSKIIVDSNQTMSDLFQYAELYTHNVSVIYLAADPIFKYDPTIKKKKFIFYVGNDKPHKNFKTLNKAWLMAFPTQKIPLIYAKGLTEVELVKCYQEAAMLVVPSLYEGFGLPVLEAMACGCPVVCSDRASLPEVAGNAALMFNAESIEELSRAMHLMFWDIPLRNSFIARGLEHVKNFTWNKTATQTLEVYRNA